MSIGDDMANNKNKNQEELVLSILKKNQSLMKVLDYIDTLQIPDYYIAAGSIYQTIWNGLDHRDLNYGIKDIDVIYYNSNDLSVETDLKLYEKITEFVTKEKIPYTIDVSNEARMHIRKKELVGREIPPYKSPIGKSTNNAKKPIVIEILPPKRILENTSLPLISAPSKNNLPSSSVVIRWRFIGIIPKNLYGSPLPNNLI